MIRKISAALSVLLFVCVVTPLDNPFFGGILQPVPAFAQSTLVLEDFALYSQKEIKFDSIGESRGNVGSNGSIDIKKGASGSVIGSFQALDRIKNEAEIGIYGDVTARIIEDKGALSLSGQKYESAALIPMILPELSFSATGEDLEVAENISMALDPGSYGHLKLKKGAALNLSSGKYYFLKFEAYEFASLKLDVSNGAIQINIVEKFKIKDDVDMQIAGGGPQDVFFNYSGSDKVEVKEHSVLRGILTAPSAKVELKKGSRLEGAAYAASIHLDKGASFRHYSASQDGRPPTADAGGHQTALTGQQVELDGSGSSDPDGDAVTYHWSFVSSPDGSSPVLSDPAGLMPTFAADLTGVYVIELAVNDGTYASLRDTATVTAVSEVLDVTDFVLYADDKIKIDKIAGGVGHVGANRHVHIEKGPSGKITGDLRVLDHIKNSGEIIIDGDVYVNSKVDDHGDLTVTGMINQDAGLAARKLPSISFSAQGPDLKVHASALEVLDPGSYGRVEVKKGATLLFSAGSYFLRELKTDDSAILICDVSQGEIELNVVKKLEFGKDSVVQITGGNSRDVRINYAGKKEVEIEDRGVLRGTLVAPKAKVEFEKDSRLEGAVYAKKIYLDKGVSFQFHEAFVSPEPVVPLSVTITSPADGIGFTRGPITVSGTVSRFGAAISINGHAASVVENQFIAHDIPLTGGANIISVQAEEGSDTAQAAVTVFLKIIDLQPVQLEITSFDQDPQSLKVSGVARVTLANNGSEDVSGSYQMILFEDTNLSRAFEAETDNILAETLIDSGPSAGSSFDVSMEFNGELLFRDNFIYLLADSADNLAETSETNNLISGKPSERDLSAARLLLDDSGCPDQALLTVRVGNSGGVAVDAGVSVAFYKGDPGIGGVPIGTAATTQALEPGHYEDLALSWESPGSGIKDIYARVDDDGTATGAFDEIDEDNNLVFTTTGVCTAPPSPGADAISGAVMDAVAGTLLSGAQVTLHLSEDGEPGAVVAQYATSGYGWFLFSDLGAGAYILKASLEGYLAGEHRFELSAGEALTNQNIVLSPVLSSEEVRIVLTWGKTPGDLEAHLTGPNPGGCRHHCYYWNKQTPGANLDLDDRESYGPETITITQRTSGDYRFYVHNFTNKGSKTGKALALSGAAVKVYFGSGAEALAFTVPDQAGTVWHVFNLDGDTGEVTPVNRMTFQDEPGKIDFPVITSYPITGAVWGTEYTYQVQVDDPDQDTLTYALAEAPAGMSIDPSTGLITWTPGTNQVSRYSVSLSVNDGRCGEDTQKFNVDVSYQPTVDFNVAPCSGFNPGGDITLTWTSSRAETVVIEPGIGEVASSGSLTIPSPEQPVAYTLRAANGAGSAVRSVPRLPEATFSAQPGCVPPGGSSTLIWSSVCAVSCEIDSGIGEVPLNGSQTVTLTEQTTYGLRCTNGRGISSQWKNISICGPKVQLAADPDCDWSPGEPVTLSWSSSNVDSCDISPGVGTVPLSGSREVQPDGPAEYVITCTGQFGDSAIDRVLIPSEPYINSFSTSPVYVLAGQSSTLKWKTRCADSVTLNQDIGEVDATGSMTVDPDDFPSTYILTATNERQTVKKYASVRHYRPSATFRVSPALIKPGESATLTWTTEIADSCSIGPDVGSVDLNGSITVSPGKNTTYRLDVSGPGGTIYKYVDLTYVKPTVQIQAVPETIVVGESTILSWIFSNADTCTIDQGIGPVEIGETRQVSPQQNTTYRISATGPGGTVTDNVTVTVITPPAITMVAPDAQAGTAYDSYTIRWSDFDSDDNASISLYYDTDNSGQDGTLIVSGLSEDGTDAYEWDITGVPNGSYYVYAVIQDDRHAPAVDYSDGAITILHTPPEIKLTAGDDSAPNDYFGQSLSISGDYAIIGNHLDDDHGDNSGSAYVFKREGSFWIKQAKLTAGDATAGDTFGISVFISGDIVIIGASGADGAVGSSGAAYVFKREGSVWSEQAKLTAGDGASSDRFGCSVSISGDYVIIGAWGDKDGGNYSGSAYVFKREDSTWSEQAKLTGVAREYDYFGQSVSISGDYAIIGAKGDDNGGSNSGAAYLFKKEGTNWLQYSKLKASDALSKDYFGTSVSISGEWAIVGADGDDDGGNYSGAAYLFKREGTTWTEYAKLTAGDAASGDYFGESVSISGDWAIVGAYKADAGAYNSGSAYIYKREGATWTEYATLTAGDMAGYDYFGQTVSISSDYAIVAAYQDFNSGNNSGSAYIYPLPTATISALPNIIEVGTFTNLTWDSKNADILTIDPDIGDVPTSGSKSVSPAGTTTYALAAIGPTGPASDSVTVYVINPTIPAAADLTATPGEIAVGQSSVLSWTCTNAHTCVIEPDIGSFDPIGSVVVAPSDTTTYTLTATGPAGTDTASATVTINQPPSIAIVEPNGVDDIAENVFSIKWTDSDPDNDAMISLYYGTDSSGQDGTLIAAGLSEDADGEGGGFEWDTSAVAEGKYYVYALIDDGINDPVAAVSDAVVNIERTLFDETKITAGDAAAYDQFGRSVSISGDWAIVGAYYDDDAGSASGAAYVYRRQGSNWTEHAKLTASDAAAYDSFGYAVSISDDWAIVGANKDDDVGSASGSAYVFKREGSNWIEHAKLTASDAAASDIFGSAVAISGDWAIVGAHYDDDDGSASGSAYVFKREGSTWSEYAKITAEDADRGDYFGYTVSISGDWAIVGAPYNSDAGYASGSAYVFQHEGGTWSEHTKLTADDAAYGDFFGNAVSISGDWAIVGAHQEEDDYDDDGSGSAYVFKRGDTTWSQFAKLKAGDAAARDHFGIAVSIDGTAAIVTTSRPWGAALNSVYLFRQEGSTWLEQAKISPNYNDSIPQDYFGHPISLSDEYAIVGAYGVDDKGIDSGSAYIYSISPVNLTADPETVLKDESATLSWSSINADGINIQPGIGSADAAGSRAVSPDVTTTYTITANSPTGPAADNVTVYVVDPAVTADISLTADSETIDAGASATLTWTSTNVGSVTIEPGIGRVDLNGSATVSPTETTTYTITAIGPNDLVSAAVTVTVTYPAPTVSISAEPAAILLGESTVLTWDSTNATTVGIDPGIGSVVVNGSTTVTPAATTTYTVTATNRGGDTVTADVTVAVAYPAPSISFNADPVSIPSGESSTLTWSTTYADTCEIDQGIDSVDVNSSRTVSPDETTTYTITATGPGGTTVADVVVTVIPPSSVTISADPATILIGQSSTLTWNSTRTDSITIAPDIGIGSAGPYGVVTVSPTATTTYTITATGPGGTITADVTVTVTPLNISITSPLAGGSITRPDIMVEGTLSNPHGHEVGVIVNGVTAIVYGDQFVANHVALEQGANTITATATDAAGNIADASIAVYADRTGDYIKITADTESGVSPFETALRIQASFSFPGFNFSYSGPDTIEFLAPGADEYRVRVTTTGIYFIMVDATDDDKNTYTDTVAVQVLNLAELDALLKAKWNGMTSALINGDINEALENFAYPSRDEYQQIFDILGDQLPGIAANMEDIQLIYASDIVAKYRIRKDETIDGQNYRVTYYLHFVRDPFGLWYIDSF